MRQISIHLKQYDNGTWEASYDGGATKAIVYAPAPSDACLEILESLQLDKLFSHFRGLQSELESTRRDYRYLLTEYNEMLQFLAKIAGIAQRLEEESRELKDEHLRRVILRLKSLFQPPTSGGR